MLALRKALPTFYSASIKPQHLVGSIRNLGMKGKSKNRRDIVMDSDDDDSLFGRSPATYSSFNDSMGVMSSIKEPVIKPRNERQRAYIAALDAESPTIVIGTGAAGTGKTMLACSIAIKKLANNEINKLIITRPMVNVDDEDGIGFLPGSLEEKCAPWLAPLTDVFYKYISPPKFQALIAKQVIEICPLDMMRGRSFEDAYIIVDEAQNCSTTQMLMLLTRIGNRTKLVITGDPMQHDRKRAYAVNGLSDFLARIASSAQTHPERVTDMCVVHFDEECIVRHPVIKNILKMYDVSYPPSS